MLVMGLSAVAYAGPGSVVIKTDGDITAKFGAQVRFVPTLEQDWDFGFARATGDGRFLSHANEAGVVNKGYIRTEDRLYFNFAKGDIWDVYFALEFDDVASSRTVDRVRDVQGAFGSFGIERLNASIKLPWILSRLNAGWDVYTVDLDAGSLVYTDDDAGFSLVGGVANFDWKLGYHKVIEANRTLAGIRGTPANLTNTGGDDDRDIYSARVNYTLFKDTKVGLIFAFNDQHVRGNFPNADPCNVPAANNVCPNIHTYYVSPIVIASIAGFKIAAQYSHSWGDTENTGIVNAASGPQGNYDIDSNAFFGDIAYDMTPWFGFRFIPHVGVLWSQGDEDATDNKLQGYVGAKNFQRFIPSFGGENTIIADGNPAYGTFLYTFLPELRGNQNANLQVGGNSLGRGDNPGLLMVGGGITVDPIKNWSFRSNVYWLRYNEKPIVPTVIAGPLGAAGTNVVLNSDDVGVALDNEVSWWLDKNMVVKGQFSFLFPGDAMKEIQGIWRGNRALDQDETAIRLAVELLWNF
jgi:hypothetical protein